MRRISATFPRTPGKVEANFQVAGDRVQGPEVTQSEGATTFNVQRPTLNAEGRGTGANADSQSRLCGTSKLDVGRWALDVPAGLRSFACNLDNFSSARADLGRWRFSRLRLQRKIRNAMEIGDLVR